MIEMRRKTDKSDYELLMDILNEDSRDSEYELYVKYLPMIEKMSKQMYIQQDRDLFVENSYLVHIKALDSLKNTTKVQPTNWVYYPKMLGYLGAERKRIYRLREKEDSFIVDIHYGYSDESENNHRIYLDNFNCKGQANRAAPENYKKDLVEYQFEKKQIMDLLNQIRKEKFTELESEIFGLKIEEKTFKRISEILNVNLTQVYKAYKSLKEKLQGSKFCEMYQQFSKRVFI
jgi:DNA-binding CsgD family transcriptional regulator